MNKEKDSETKMRLNQDFVGGVSFALCFTVT